MNKKEIAAIAIVLVVAGIIVGVKISNPPAVSPVGNVTEGPPESTGETITSGGTPTKSTRTSPSSRIDLRRYLGYLAGGGYELRLDGLSLVDGDLAQLKNSAFQGVRSVSLMGTPITDKGLPYLRGLPLYSLALSKTKITDAGLVYLKDLPLKQLFLAQTDITDAGLEHLKTLPLVLLDLRNAKVTYQGVAGLQRAIPDIQIMR